MELKAFHPCSRPTGEEHHLKKPGSSYPACSVVDRTGVLPTAALAAYYRRFIEADSRW